MRGISLRHKNNLLRLASNRCILLEKSAETAIRWRHLETKCGIGRLTHRYFVTSTFLRNSSTQETDAKPTADEVENLSIAPLPVRLAVIGGSVGLCTPIFGVAGVVQIWRSYLPQTLAGKAIKTGLSFIFSGGIVSITYYYIIPFFYSHSELILPFAVSNAAASSFWYLLGDVIFGFKVMANGVSLKASFPESWLSKSFPFPNIVSAGPVIGILTAITVPLIWSHAFQLCWDDNLYQYLLQGDPHWVSSLYSLILLPVAIPVGFFSGVALQTCLKPALIVDKIGSRWQGRTLPILAVLTSLGVLYFIQFQSSFDDFFWESRMDVKSGSLISYNSRTKSTIKDSKIADSSRHKRYAVHIFHKGRMLVSSMAMEAFQISSPQVKSKNDESSNTLGSRISELYHPSLVESRESLYSIVDILVRYKYLSDLIDSGKAGTIDTSKSQKELKDLFDFGRENYGIDNLRELYDKSMLALIACRRVASVDCQKKDTVLKQFSLDKLAQLSEGNKIFRGKQGIAYLYKNIDVLGIELADKLDYRLSQEDEKMLVERIETQEARERLTTIGTTVGILAIGSLVFCLSVFSSSK